MKAIRNTPLLRKALLLACLAVASLLAAEVYQRLTARTPEEALTALGATQLMTQSLSVNGRQMTADVWRLPDFASADPVRKTRGKALIVGKVVYVFNAKDFPERGEGSYPADLPAWNITCDYVVDAGHSRFVNGRSPDSPETLLTALEASAKAAGWESLGPKVWRKGRETLLAHAVEGRGETQAVLIVQKEME